MASIKNWSKFQHFKDRKPPWVKLYRDILDDIEWHELPAESAKTLVMLWLIASEEEGQLPDIKTLAFRLRCTVRQLETQLKDLSHWIETERYQVDIKPSQKNSVAEVSDHQETETETETETEPPRKRVAPPDGVGVETWKAFLAVRRAKKAPLSDLAMAGITREAEKAGWTLEAALSECVTRGWTAFKADWVAGKQTFAQQAADVSRQTVPSRAGMHPTLVQIVADMGKAAPMPDSAREALKKLKGVA